MAGESPQTEQLLDQIVSLLALSVTRDSQTQTEAIMTLARAGLQPAKIAELLDTSPGSVRATQSQAGKKSK
jgi:DNA-binding CsgD family transcriptional regulator